MGSTPEKTDEIASCAFAARDAIATLCPGRVILPSSTKFADAQNSFWNALQRRKTPACFFQPTSADEVKAAIVEVARAKCPFAIKGGGHSSNSEGSSIQGGIQFDLVNLNHIEIADDKKTVRVGPGLQWGPLFKELEKHGVITVGGRDFGVGIPGFIFGGGLSYYSAQYGWGIDGLVAADIVLASGELVTVDSASHPGLHRALHGGGAHNFGIVTSLTLKLHPYNGMWGGMNVIHEEHFDTFFDTYDKYTHDLTKDSKAHMILDFFRSDGAVLVAQFLGYPEPTADPPIYDAFRRIPSLSDTLRLADYSDLAAEMAEVTDSRGKRNAYWTLSMEHDINLLKSAYTLWSEMTEPYVGRFDFVFDVNHITPAMRNKAAREGAGNVYGLEGPDEPMTLILLTGVWNDDSDDKEFMAVLRSLGLAIEALTKQKGKSRTFKYMNYANQEQDVIAGFGEKNKQFLEEVSAKYDPERVFERLHQAGHKLHKLHKL